jgi:hypothetical protein
MIVIPMSRVDLLPVRDSIPPLGSESALVLAGVLVLNLHGAESSVVGPVPEGIWRLRYWDQRPRVLLYTTYGFSLVLSEGFQPSLTGSFAPPCSINTTTTFEQVAQESNPADARFGDQADVTQHQRPMYNASDGVMIFFFSGTNTL